MALALVMCTILIVSAATVVGTKGARSGCVWGHPRTPNSTDVVHGHAMDSTSPSPSTVSHESTYTQQAAVTGKVGKASPHLLCRCPPKELCRRVKLCLQFQAAVAWNCYSPLAHVGAAIRAGADGGYLGTWIRWADRRDAGSLWEVRGVF